MAALAEEELLAERGEIVRQCLLAAEVDLAGLGAIVAAPQAPE